MTHALGGFVFPYVKPGSVRISSQKRGGTPVPRRMCMEPGDACLCAYLLHEIPRPSVVEASDFGREERPLVRRRAGSRYLFIEPLGEAM